MNDDQVGGVNPTDNPSLDGMLRARVSRRMVLGGSLAGALALWAGPAAASERPASGDGKRGRRPLLGFAPVAPGSADAIVVPDGYVAEVLIPWGTPLWSDAPAWNKDASNTAAEQAMQVGNHHDGMHFFPFDDEDDDDCDRGLLVLNHEYIDQILFYPDGSTTITKEKVDKALAAHGVTVVEIARHDDGTWHHVVDSPFNRRITGATPVAFSGPVAVDHPMLRSGNAPMGTLNNCAMGVTPWGTYLTCEENWNGYFGASAAYTPTALEARYGVTAAGFGYKWHVGDPARFDLNLNRNELNRFGWVVEIDPFRPRSTPVKRTALGRVKHEGATCAESGGQVVVYTGDDEDKDYLYKFVGDGKWKARRRRGQSPLDHGVLYVAVFAADGTGSWVPLVHGTGALTTANGWADQADVLIRTRQAADAVGATKLDRPEWITVHPRTSDVYVSLTNGTSGSAGISPRNPNPYGHIARLSEADADHRSLTFSWDIFVLAGDPAYDARVTLAPEDVFGSPDGLAFDDDGRLWIETDISNSSQNRPDRGYDHIGNNGMLCADTETGEIRRFLVGPRGCELTGITFSPDHRTMFVNVQHPGELTTFWGTPTPADPRKVSNWPDFDPDGRPRSATVVIRRRDGGRIGS